MEEAALVGYIVVTLDSVLEPGSLSSETTSQTDWIHCATHGIIPNQTIISKYLYQF